MFYEHENQIEQTQTNNSMRKANDIKNKKTSQG